MARDIDDLAIETGRHVRRLAAIDDAASEMDVVRIVRDHLASLTRIQLTGLPEDCWPGRIADRKNIAVYAARLARRRVLSSESLADRLMVQRLCELMAHSVARVALLSRIEPRELVGAEDETW